MTQEEKAKAYDRVSKEVKDFFEGMQKMYSDVSQTLEYLFPELKESEDEKIRKKIIAFLKTYDTLATRRYITWLEKQGGQNESDVKDYNGIDPHFGKSIDKIEPNFNFKAGQWIVATGKCVYLITKIDGFNVTLVDTDGNEYVFDTSSLEDAHLWTIADAKGGDVLKEDSCIFIIKRMKSDGTAIVHCCLFDDGDFELNSNLGFDDTCTYPATKEQCDLLFQKIKKEGYEWDTDKKELKKINNKEVNGEDYGIDSLWHAKNILEETLGKVDGYQTDDGILEHKCAIAAVNKTI